MGEGICGVTRMQQAGLNMEKQTSDFIMKHIRPYEVDFRPKLRVVGLRMLSKIK